MQVASPGARILRYGLLAVSLLLFLGVAGFFVQHVVAGEKADPLADYRAMEATAAPDGRVR